jgi:NAD(P)-dependent dehydrogenase (short-subunit alcohol dehydrogenase family)
MGRLEAKVAVVTGGASGIGAAIVDRFIEEGAVVVVADLQDAVGPEIVDRYGPSARFCRTDVTDEAEVAAAVELAVSSFGRLDVMVNNAGIIGAVGPIAETTEASFDETVGVLLKGVFLGTKQAARVMTAQGSGVIISTASTAGIIGGLGPHLYTAAKHAVVGLTKSVANELGPHGIRVNSVAPGSTVTPMTTTLSSAEPEEDEVVAERLASRCLLGIAGLPADIANGVVYLASDEARYVTGHCLVIVAGQTTSGTVGHRFPEKDHTVLRGARADG